LFHPNQKAMQSFHSRKKQSRWRDFLNTSIFLDRGVQNIAPRHRAISIFVNEGLLPFVQTKGYNWIYSAEKTILTLLHMLFEMYEGRKIRVQNLQTNYPSDYFDLFLQHFDTEEWELFWERWGLYEDFQEDRYAHEFRYLLQNYIWNSVNLENSAAIQDLFEELEERNETDRAWRTSERSKGKDDPYLQDLHQGVIVQDKHKY
jgi:hypothetical protein